MARRAAKRSGLAVVDYASVDGEPMRHEHLVVIGGSTNIVVESIAAPPLSAPRPVDANVAETRPPDDEMKQEMARRVRM